jgi:hypothetical protein
VAPVPGRTLKTVLQNGHRFCDRFDSATAGAPEPHLNLPYFYEAGPSQKRPKQSP